MARLASIEELMDFDAFTQFAGTRSENEKWELFDGVPVLNASPNFPHQIIVRNIIGIFRDIEKQARRTWTAIPGIGVRLARTSAAEPDVMIRPLDGLASNYCDDAIAAFEILSPSTAKRDLVWKRDAYAKLSSMQDYVIVAPDEIRILVYSRANNWAMQRFTDLNQQVTLPGTGAVLQLADIYRDIRTGP